MSAKYQLREMGPGDTGFVFKTYIQGGHETDMFREMHPKAFSSYAPRLLQELLDRSQCVVLCDKDRPTKLHGFAIAEWPFTSMEQMILHYVFVKLDDRKQGLCNAMINALGHRPGKTLLYVSHVSGQWKCFGRDKFGSIYNPLMLFPQYHTEKRESAE